MNDNLTADLTKEERDILLRGLRYVRSSVMLEMSDPEVDAETDRASRLESISTLADRLSNAPVGAHAGV